MYIIRIIVNFIKYQQIMTKYVTLSIYVYCLSY